MTLFFVLILSAVLSSSQLAAFLTSCLHREVVSSWTLLSELFRILPVLLENEYNVVCAGSLFPTIERMAESPNGQRLFPILSVWFVFISALEFYIPLWGFFIACCSFFYFFSFISFSDNAISFSTWPFWANWISLYFVFETHMGVGFLLGTFVMLLSAAIIRYLTEKNGLMW